MPEEEKDKLIAEQERWLSYETFIARVLKERTITSQKPVWQRFLESAGGAAMITVLIGGIAGAYISSAIQSRAKDREFQMLAYKDFVGKRDEFGNRLQHLIGTSISAAEDLMSLYRPEWTIRPELDQQTKDRLTQYKEKTNAKFDEAETNWRNEQDSLGYLVTYYYPKQDDVIKNWQPFKDSLTKYFDCARTTYDSKKPNSTCKNEQAAFEKSGEALKTALEAGRKYIWEDVKKISDN